MDWAVTARTTTPHVRDVIADRELETWALVDMSASMDFGTAALEKRELAVAAVGTVGFLTHRLGDRFGGSCCAAAGRRGGRPGPGGSRCTACCGRCWPSPVPLRPSPTDDFAAALDQLARTQQQRGLRVVVSDFLDGSADDPAVPLAWERPMRRLSGRHQVLAVEVLDPRELELPDVGVVWLTDPETGAVAGDRHR